MLKILLIDDHKIVRDGVKLYLDNRNGYEVVAEASDGHDAFNRLMHVEADLVIVDINMKGLNGIETARRIRSEYPQLKILALTMHNDYQNIKNMMDAGASGYVLKSCGEDEMIKAIDTVMAGDVYYSQEVAQTVMNNMARKNTVTTGDTPLTPREKEIYRLIMKEYGNSEIADELFISVRTVEVHKRNLLEKTGAKNTAGLVLYAVKHNLFPDM